MERNERDREGMERERNHQTKQERERVGEGLGCAKDESFC